MQTEELLQACWLTEALAVLEGQVRTNFYASKEVKAQYSLAAEGITLFLLRN